MSEEEKIVFEPSETQEAPKTPETQEAPQTPAKRKKKKGVWKKIVKWLILLLVLAAAAFFLLRGRLGRRSAAASATAAAYTTQQPMRRTVKNAMSGSGSLQPADSYTVTTLVEGEILQAAFEEGDKVDKDQVLYRIDSSDVSNSIEQAGRSLEQATLSRGQAERSLEQAQRNYDKAVEKQYVRSDVAGTIISLAVEEGDKINAGQTVATVRDGSVMELEVPFPADDAEDFYPGQAASVTLDSTFETLSGTVKEISPIETVGMGNTITRAVTVTVTNPGGLSDVQAATASVAGVNCAGSGTFTYRAQGTVTSSVSGMVTELRVARGDRVEKNGVVLVVGGDYADTIQSAADSLQNSTNSVRNSQLSLENARLNVEKAQNQLDNYTVKSPISGTIVDKRYKAGDTVSNSDRTLCTIYDLSYLEMIINIDELDITSVQVGQSVDITADAVPGKSYTGTITKVSLLSSTGSGGAAYYPVTIRLDEFEGLRPGMNADAEIVLEEAENVLTVPSAAIGRGDFVLITADSPSAANAAERQAPEGYVYVKVETGISDDDYTQILSGLTEQDTIAYSTSSGGMGMMMPGMGMGMGMGMGGGMPAGGMGGNRGGSWGGSRTGNTGARTGGMGGAR